LKKDKQILVTSLKIIIFLIGIKFVIFNVMGKRLHSMKRNAKIKARRLLFDFFYAFGTIAYFLFKLFD